MDDPLQALEDRSYEQYQRRQTAYSKRLVDDLTLGNHKLKVVDYVMLLICQQDSSDNMRVGAVRHIAQLMADDLRVELENAAKHMLNLSGIHADDMMREFRVILADEPKPSNVANIRED